MNSLSLPKWLTPRLMELLAVLCCQILVAEYAVGFALWYAMADGLRDLSDTPLGADFLNVYAAGKMALRGEAAQVYDWARHGEVEQTLAGYQAPYFGWHYPPMFLMAAAGLAALPYLVSFTAYLAAGFAGYMAVIRRIAPKSRAALWATAAFPGVFANISNGQNGFITAGLFGAGLLALEQSPMLAGLGFGLLSYKPQFFVVIPLMLAIGGYGRALAATCATALASAALSWVMFGEATWQAFFASAQVTQHVILEQGSTGWRKIESVFSMARLLGCSVTAAYIWQGFVAVLALAAAAKVWRCNAAMPTKAAALGAAMLLATPYMLDYDLVLLAVPIAYLARQGIENGFLKYEKITLLLLWILPLLARSLGGAGVPVTPPALLLLLALCVARGKK